MMPETKAVTVNALGNVLSQKPLIREADTRTIIERAKESGQSFEAMFDEGIRNMTNYKTEITPNGNDKPNGNGRKVIGQKK
jgi:hypothetical protein